MMGYPKLSWRKIRCSVCGRYFKYPGILTHGKACKLKHGIPLGMTRQEYEAKLLQTKLPDYKGSKPLKSFQQKEEP